MMGANFGDAAPATDLILRRPRASAAVSKDGLRTESWKRLSAAPVLLSPFETRRYATLLRVRSMCKLAP